MTVGRRLSWTLTALLTCTALVGAAALLGLLGLSRHHQRADRQHENLRTLYEVGHHAAVVRVLLAEHGPEEDVVARELARVLVAARQLDADRTLGGSDSAGRRAVVERLEGLASAFSTRTDPAVVLAEVNRTLGTVAALASREKAAIAASRAAAGQDFRTVVWALATLLAVSIVVAAAAGIRLHRAIMRPLRSLEEAVEGLGVAQLGRQVEEQGDREFRRLAQHFNQTSRSLAREHARMRVEVEFKSRQLVRSEQLASVGVLAAGLAHEINNPLGIIAGYAERSLRRLESTADASGSPAVQRKVRFALQTICDEAFRCRDITRDLLLLAQPEDANAVVVPLVPLVERAVALLHGLPLGQGHDVVIRAIDPESQLACMGRPSQLLQVFINLLANALEAAPPPAGRVEVVIERRLDQVLLSFADNGCGMTAAVLERAFDPFFTSKPRCGLSGCGLGLSVSHAIVERHAGRIYAESAGSGLGSTFLVELPAVALRTGQAVHASATG